MQFQTYPFEKLNNLLKDIIPNKNFEPLSLTIGEPQFETSMFIQEKLQNSTQYLNKYPKSAGEQFLKDSMINFVKKRFNIQLDNNRLIPTFGTREVLFNFPQFLLFDKKNPKMAFTNPFYQIYEGSAIASRAKILYLNLTETNNFKPIIEEDKLKDCDLVILNFPNNPTSSTLTIDELSKWVELALKYNFVLLNDECYSEIYFDKKPVSLLEASKKIGNNNFKNILIINSISKRSSAPSLRSGFIAGDSTILKEYMKYRTYIGCAIPLPLQYASAIAWNDEEHTQIIRNNYKKNFELANSILNIKIPEATFYIWLKVDNDLKFTQELYKSKNLKVLPGSFLGRNNIGSNFIRIALVYEPIKTKIILERLKSFFNFENNV